VNIGRIGSLNLPRLAEGGIVKARPGGILANIGEGGKDEAVIPLDKLENMMKGNGTQVNFYGNITITTKEAADAFFNRLNAQAELASMGVPV
jgi:inorganic pyrophosphatase